MAHAYAWRIRALYKRAFFIERGRNTAEADLKNALLTANVAVVYTFYAPEKSRLRKGALKICNNSHKTSNIFPVLTKPGRRLS